MDGDNKHTKPRRHARSRVVTGLLSLVSLILVVLVIGFLAKKSRGPEALRRGGRDESGPHPSAAAAAAAVPVADHEPHVMEPPILDSLRPDEPSHADLQEKLDQMERQLRLTQAALAQKANQQVEAHEECLKVLRALHGKANDTLKAWNTERRRMTRYMTERAHAEVVRRFGSEPARVLMTTSEGDMLIEMAPPSLMPVVTLYFLDQVDSGFWDGMSFFRAESHVIQASDVMPNGKRKRNSNVHGIPFQEYTSEFPHHKYTLGIAGRPGGPDFYVNMQENLRIHGPGGQGHNYAGNDEADSCFAKLIKGTEVADAIQKLPFDSSNGLHILKKPVEIIKAVVLMRREEGEEAAADE